MVTIREYLHAARQQNASHIYFHVGSRPAFKRNGDLHRLGNFPRLNDEDLNCLKNALNEAETGSFAGTSKDRIHSVSIDEETRVRVTASQNRQGLSIACRLLPSRIPVFETLFLPMVLKDMMSLASGLILVIGRAGSGKTTTLAALIDRMNREQKRSIFTIEHPIEFIHSSKKSLINQMPYSETHAAFDRNWKSALTETMDVLVLDGIPPEEFISPALSAASEGLLVLASVESNGGVAEVLNRMINNCPSRERENRRRLMARTLRGAIWQHLFPCKDGLSMKPAFEILLNDAVISHQISRKGHLNLLRPTMAAGRYKGMQTMHQALSNLKTDSLVKIEDINAFEKDMLNYYVLPVKNVF